MTYERRQPDADQHSFQKNFPGRLRRSGHERDRLIVSLLLKLRCTGQKRRISIADTEKYFRVYHFFD
jgi:hypothetical protein